MKIYAYLVGIAAFLLLAAIICVAYYGLAKPEKLMAIITSGRTQYTGVTGHPRLEAYRRLGEMAIDPIRFEWGPYYYRHPRPQEAIKVFEVLQDYYESAAPTHKTDGADARPELVNKNYTHYFATIFARNKDELEKFKIATRGFSRAKQAAAAAIINEAENYKPVTEITEDSIKELVSEYMVTGDQTIIRRLAERLGTLKAAKTAPTPESNRLTTSVQTTLVLLISSYNDANKTFLEVREQATGDIKQKLNEVNLVYDRLIDTPASTHMNKAHQYSKQGDYDAALDEFERSLYYVQDYANVFAYVGKMYELQGNMPYATKAMEKAVQIDPDNSPATFDMGRFMFVQGRYDDAIKWYSEAVRQEPNNGYNHFTLGQSYGEKGDLANAVKHFQKSIELAPNGKHTVAAKKYLAMLGATAPVNDTLLGNLLAKQFDVLEARMTKLLQEKQRDERNVSLLRKAYDELTNDPDAGYNMEQRLAEFEAWVDYNPSSHFANAALGKFYISYAWFARGYGYSDSVTEESWVAFKTRMAKAKQYLEKSYALDTSDAIVPAYILDALLGIGPKISSSNTSGAARPSEEDIRAAYIQEATSHLNKSIKADPNEYSAYESMQMFLMPQWGGSYDAMLQFARKVAREDPEGSVAPRIMARAHWGIYMNVKAAVPDYFKNPDVWNELKPAYAELCRRFPQSIEIHSWFARTAYLSGDIGTLKEQMEILGDNWDESAWTKEDFLKAKAMVKTR